MDQKKVLQTVALANFSWMSGGWTVLVMYATNSMGVATDVEMA